MRAIRFEANSLKVIEVTYGESAFKKIDEFWLDFTPDGGEKTTAFAASLVKDTPMNRTTVQALVDNSLAAKEMADKFDKNMYQIRNRLER